jgi:hypothetical protein
MSRIWTLTRFLIGDLIRSLAAIVPLAAAVAFGLIAFEYGMDQSQFITVAGIGIGAICLLTTLLLASRANRASTYPLLARLRHRAELLAALVLSGLIITILLALLIALPNLIAGRLTLEFPSMLWIGPTWLALWLMASALALPLSSLTARAGSHLVGYALVTLLLVANDRKAMLKARDMDWLVTVVTILLWPVSTLMARASAGVHDRLYFLALALVVLSALFFFTLAAQFLANKDLLWAE